jgi:transcriptional regulator with GAF, ATPase, and Fis domain
VNARNIHELERQHAQMERQLAAERRLLEISEQLVSTLDPRRVLEQIADTIGDVVSYDRLTIFRQDPTSAAIEPVLARPEPGEADVPVISPHLFDEGLTS